MHLYRVQISIPLLKKDVGTFPLLWIIIYRVACAISLSVTTSSTNFSFQNLVFQNLLEFSMVESFWYLPHFESKSYQINSIKSCSSRFFQHTKGTLQSFQNFQLWFNLIFNEEIIQYSQTFAPQVQIAWNQSHALFFIENFPKVPRI